jgi:bifunctional UDP-N-acetylglucosamine pyrophosphorylase/glucosamine-1-phosphate N-acetyltransferase
LSKSDMGVVILAAGHGTRMKSRKNKILHEVGGSPMIQLVFESAMAVSDTPPVVVVGPNDDAIRPALGDQASYVEQSQRMGTGHATMMASQTLRGKGERVLVTYADMPLLRSATMERLAQKQEQSKAAVVILTVMGSSQSTFGRILRENDGLVSEIVEVAEAKRRPNAQEILQTRELNAGVYCFDADWLWANLPNLPLRQARDGQEYYLTDMVGLAVSQGLEVEAIVVDDPDECLGAGTRQELAVVERAYRRRINNRWMASGVTMIDPEATYIDKSVTIGRDCIIWPNTHISGETDIGEGCLIGPNAVIRDAAIGRDCRIEQAVIEKITLDDGTVVEPFSCLRG